MLEDRYDFEHPELITLEVRGNAQWNGDDSRLEHIYDEHADRLRVQQPARIQQTSCNNGLLSGEEVNYLTTAIVRVRRPNSG
jgi:hypothetical protein